MTLAGQKEKYAAALRQLQGGIQARLSWQRQKAEGLRADIKKGQNELERRIVARAARRRRRIYLIIAAIAVVGVFAFLAYYGLQTWQKTPSAPSDDAAPATVLQTENL